MCNAKCVIYNWQSMKELGNPFTVYNFATDDYFCSRQAEQEQLLSALRNGRNVTLMSERRMGKTGLIINMFEQLKREKNAPVCIYADIFSTKSLNDFVQILARQILGRFDSPIEKALATLANFFKNSRVYMATDPLTGEPQIGLDFQAKEAKHTLLEIFSYLRSLGKEFYLAIDEFQQIAAYADSGIEALLREQMQFTKNVRFIFSGSKQHLMNEIFTSPNRPFYRSTDKIQLFAIPKDTYRQFAQKFFTKAKRSLSNEVFDEIYDRFEGHTWYMQYILNRLWESGKQKIEQQDIQTALLDILAAEDENFRNIYDNLTENQCMLLRAIASEGIVEKVNASEFIKKYDLGIPSSVNRALHNLIDRELVLKMPNGYRVYDRFMAIWLKRLFVVNIR